MPQENSDLTFFTNEKKSSLLDRFKATLKHVKYFDILVGYFRTSGFFRLYQDFEGIEKIRILVGLNVDRTTFEIYDSFRNGEFDFASHLKTKQKISSNIQQEIENAEDDYDVEQGIHKFMEFLRSDKIEFRAYPSANIHAKVYISRFPEGHYDYGRVITGSSNFSEAGLLANREFNVELKNKQDVDFALSQFEELWKDGVPLNQEYIDTIQSKTWLKDDISPYHLYLKFLYEYFKEDINIDQEGQRKYLPPGFMELEYQTQSVTSARKILSAYNGVFLADVVGLGKTYTAARLAQQLNGGILIICPPSLKDYWHDTFFQFRIPSFDVESMGMLDNILSKDVARYEYVIIDEAHRFRNEYTQGYEKLYQICFGKKVILVSATPLNNSINDIFSQLKLFQIPKKSTIPGVPDLESFFNEWSRTIKKAKQDGQDEYFTAVRDAAHEIRHKIFQHIMVRRTRCDVKKYFSDDMKKNGLSFPELEDPRRLIYAYKDNIESVFQQSIDLLKEFSYARYTPLLSLKDELSDFARQSQRNIGGFMKGLLVKRLESSFYAFRKSLGRFIKSYEDFIKMYENGTVYISKKVDVYDFLDNDNEDSLIQLVEQNKVSMYSSDRFNSDFPDKLKNDLKILKSLQSLWNTVSSDPKLDGFLTALKDKNSVLSSSKIIIFSESKETGEYLFSELSKELKENIIFFSSDGGQIASGKLNVQSARDIIRENFDPNYKKDKQKNDLRILITTDVLAEGINLHRSNVVINYDLPWNPTRVMQRSGRINRVGTVHKKTYIFNFFPTSQSEEHLGLEENIKAKLQAFHDTLGADAKYLTEEEEPESKELFGDRLLKRLSDKATYEGEDDEHQSELGYLTEIRKVRDKHPELFKKIKELPRKARTARKINRIKIISLLSFFRKGMLKKFYLTAGNRIPQELTFFEAVELMRCEAREQKLNIDKNYYPMLAGNKNAFETAVDDNLHSIISKKQGGGSNYDFLKKLLLSNEIKYFEGFTDEDEYYIKKVLFSLNNGIIPRNTVKHIVTEFKNIQDKTSHQLKLLGILRTSIPDSILDINEKNCSSENVRREVILSEILYPENI